MRLTRPRSAVSVCSIGSTDPTARAGIGRDLAVYAHLGVRATLAIAAVTAQNARRVISVLSLPPALLGAQLRAIWQERPPDAIRIGLLPSRAVIAQTRDFLASLHTRPASVLDPVLASSSGHRFLDARARRALTELFPLATLITPNVDEAERFSGVRIRSAADAERAALRLHEYGCAVLIKGGHLRGRLVVDVLAARGKITRFAAPRIQARARGSGCTLAAAIAVFLARRAPIVKAIRLARAYQRRMLKGAAAGAG